MERRYLAFDIEIAKVLPDHIDDLKAHRPLGITCAANLAADDNQPHFWYTQGDGEKAAPKMSRSDLSKLVDFLKAQVTAGYTIVTWNGVGFDFDILGEESARVEDCRQLAIDHVDMMFHIFCEKGFGVSLDAAAKSIRSHGKPRDMNATMAPKLWAAGETEDVLKYVANDCKMTVEVAEISERKRSFRWITQRGTESDLYLRSGCPWFFGGRQV